MKEKDPAFIPNSVRLLMTFIDRVGFPIVAFLLMFYLCVYSIAKLTDRIQDNTAMLQSLNKVLERQAP